jgi:hypothetical protein
MLDLLLEGFDARVCLAEDAGTIRDRLREERSRLMDPAHLQSEVIGKPRWAWDFESLGEGFMDLVSPFMAREAGVSHLYLQALREFGRCRPEDEHMIVLLEYTHYASLIEDYYDFHEMFSRSEPDSRHCSRLTQLKFAGQYLGLSPTHLIVRNALRAGEGTLLRVHRWIRNTYITWGISRGVLLKWLAARFAGVQRDPYRQNSINALCAYFLSPIVMAAIMAERSEEFVRQLKVALSWLTLSVKVRCERRALLGQLSPHLGAHHANALLLATQPGALFIQKGLALPDSVGDTLAAMHAEMMRCVQDGLTAADLVELEQQELGYFTRFREQMEQLACAPGLVRRLADCLGQKVGA